MCVTSHRLSLKPFIRLPNLTPPPDRLFARRRLLVRTEEQLGDAGQERSGPSREGPDSRGRCVGSPVRRRYVQQQLAPDGQALLLEGPRARVRFDHDLLGHEPGVGDGCLLGRMRDPSSAWRLCATGNEAERRTDLCLRRPVRLPQLRCKRADLARGCNAVAGKGSRPAEAWDNGRLPCSYHESAAIPTANRYTAMRTAGLRESVRAR